MDWFKCYNGATTDKKFLRLSKSYDVPVYVLALCWMHFCDHASQQKERGSLDNIDFEDIDFFYGFEDGQSQQSFNAFVEKGMIEDNRLAKWDDRQKNETAEKQKRYRERKKKETLRNDGNESNALRNDGNALPEEKRREEKREEEKDILSIDNKQDISSSTSTPEDENLNWINSDGIQYLAQAQKRPLPELKTIIEGWIKFHNAVDVRTAIMQAQVSVRGDPVNYVIQILKNKKTSVGTVSAVKKPKRKNWG